MKIQGPKGPKAPGVEGPEKTQESGQAEGASFVDRLKGAGGPGGPGGPAGADPIAALARQVEAGTMTGKQAVDRLMEMASSQGALAALPDAVRARLRTQLEELLQADPYLAAKAKRLGVGEES